RHVRETLHRPGSPDAPLDAVQLSAKFEQLAGHVLDAGGRERLRAAVDALERLPTLQPLIDALQD
ncbi:MAG: hypothetical protein KF834_10815, partial [Burkholderiales bacterium]|nr:hypothetical protein [Burkholderiales bacterium]